MKTQILTGTGEHTFQIDDTQVHVFFLHNYSGTLTTDIRVVGAQVYIFGLYLGTESDSFTLNTIQHHVIGGSESNLLIKGVFKDASRFQYEGLIRIEPGAHESNAYQKNQNLILSNDVYVDSRPYLEILADDVRCTHGSTTGRLNTDQLQYVQSRGLDHEQAEDLLVDGFITDMFDQLHLLGCTSITRSFLGI